MSLINSIVDQVYLVNLSRHTDRLKKVSDRLNKLEIKFERFEAIDALNDTELRDKWITLLENGSDLSSPGAFGCLLSHLEIIKLAKKQEFKSILIFEDDVYFHKEFDRLITRINNIPENSGIIYLGATQFEPIYDHSCYYKAHNTFGTFAYIIRDFMYDILIETFETYKADIDYLLISLQNNYNFYVLWDNLVIADLNSSDIRTEKYQYSELNWDISNYDMDGTLTKPKRVSVSTIQEAIDDINTSKDILLKPGFCFLIRAKNEEFLVESCIKSIVEIADEIVFVDNGSTDKTFEIISRFANLYNNIKIYRYNINVPKAGKLHELMVESGSQNTLATYYNWCLSKVTRYNVIKWDCDFIAIRENLIKMINKYDLKNRSDNFSIWFTGRTLFYGKYLRENDYYDEFRVFSKKNGFKWENYKGCETAAYHIWSLDKCYVNGFMEIFTDIRYKNLNEYKKQSPPVFYEIKLQNDFKYLNNLLDSRDVMDNNIISKLWLPEFQTILNISNLTNQRLKILITIPGLSVGGGNLWVVNIYKTLIEFGFDVKIYCNFSDIDESQNIYGKDIDHNDIIIGLAPDVICDMIIYEGFNYVIQTTPLLHEYHLVKIPKSVKIYVLTHSDVSYINNYILNLKKYFHKIITVNNTTIKKLSNFGINNTHFLPNYITDIDFQKDKQIQKKIGIISRLSSDKNIIMTLYAFRNLINDSLYSDYTLHIVGSDSIETMNLINFYIKNLNLTDNVILYGYQSDVISYYRNFDFIILPSVSEGCPYNLLEAALVGTPIICSNVGGNHEIVQNYGVLFELEGIREFSEKTLYVNSYNQHLEIIGYSSLEPDNSKSEIWYKNTNNITNAFKQMIDNYDHYEREKLMKTVKKKYGSKKIFVNSLINLLDLNFEII